MHRFLKRQSQTRQRYLSFFWTFNLGCDFYEALEKFRFCPLASDVREGKGDKKAIDEVMKHFGGNEGTEDGGVAEADKTEIQGQDTYDEGLGGQISETPEEDLSHRINEVQIEEQEQPDKVAIFEWVNT